jgi:hypothetical protein
VAARSEARNVFGRSDTGIVVSKPSRGMNVCVYSVFVLSYVGKRPCDKADHPFKESYQLHKVQNFRIDFEREQAREPNSSRQREINLISNLISKL